MQIPFRPMPFLFGEISNAMNVAFQKEFIGKRLSNLNRSAN